MPDGTAAFSPGNARTSSGLERVGEVLRVIADRCGANNPAGIRSSARGHLLRQPE
jgi:hypothetical protein